MRILAFVSSLSLRHATRVLDSVAKWSAAIALLAPLARTAEIESLEPTAKSKPDTWHQAESKAGLHYAWKIPKGYDRAAPRNLTVILHGTGLDWRWGPANSPVGVFRPEDIVVSVDGTSPGAGKSRLFLQGKKDVAAFAEFLGEMKAAFAVKDVFLYGHSQGGFFVTFFAGEHPELVTGVVAHASGSWLGIDMSKKVRKVAIAFMHGTSDPVVPFGQSPAARDAYVKAGFERVLLRRLPFYNHWPNAVRATECLDWCEGITTDDPAVALQTARRIASVKKPDEYQWETAAGFAAAHDVLRRFETKGSFAALDEKLVAEASALAKKIEAHASKHVQSLEKDVPSEAGLKLVGDWLGHMVSLREDFRGIGVVEDYVKKIGYDDVLALHAKAARVIYDAWYGSTGPKKTFEAIVTAIDDAFLVEGYPPELAEKLSEWKSDAKKLGIDAKALKTFESLEAWKSGWSEGAKRYGKLWKEWKGP